VHGAAEHNMIALLPCLAAVIAPIDEYVNRPEPVFTWNDTGARVRPLIFGGMGYVINVTSLSWLNTSIVSGDNGAVWSHQVVVVVPKVLKTNTSIIYLTGDCSNPSLPKPDDEELLVVARAAEKAGAIGVVVHQIPNCPLVFASDPAQRRRGEDALIAWSWRDFLNDPSRSPERLVRLPMVKAAYQCMRAVEEFTRKEGLGSPDGWVVSGASKRGWTTWMVGAAYAGCPSCPKVAGLAPLVPIVPDIHAEVHRQWKSYNGFTFAFKDYVDAGIIAQIDSDAFEELGQIVDPKYYAQRLAALPKVVVDSSDDEFMQFDWTEIWRSAFEENTRLLIAPNSEHSLATGLPSLVPTLAATVASIAQGVPLPSFTSTHDNTTGGIRVTLPAGSPFTKVVLRHAETLSKTRRDFRWVRLADNETSPCKLPEVHLHKPVFGGNCVVPIVWHGKTLKPQHVTEDGETVFVGIPPEPKAGHWTGYYVEVYFKAAVDDGELMFTSTGHVWPDTLPFPDCHGTECVARLV